MSGMPKVPPEQIEVAAQQISNALTRTFFWHENFSTLSAMLAKNRVSTNIAEWVFYGMAVPKVTHQIGEVQITAASPTSYHLIGTSQIPTSQQKVTLMDAVVVRILRKLGASGSATIRRQDPTRGGEVTEQVLGRVIHDLEHGEAGDPYKQIGVPYVVSATWPAAETDPRWVNKVR